MIALAIVAGAFWIGYCVGEGLYKIAEAIRITGGKGE